MSRIIIYYLSGKVEKLNIVQASISNGCLALSYDRYGERIYIPLTSIEKWEII
jgi:hypothetical protein